MFEAVFGAKVPLGLATMIEGLLLTTVAATSRAHAGAVGWRDRCSTKPTSITSSAGPNSNASTTACGVQSIGGCLVSLTLYSHPFASYCQKVLIALWENEVPFTYRHLEEPGAAEERAALWPLGRFPVLVDDGRTIAESSIIIEHLDLH